MNCGGGGDVSGRAKRERSVLFHALVVVFYLHQGAKCDKTAFVTRLMRFLEFRSKFLFVAHQIGHASAKILYGVDLTFVVLVMQQSAEPVRYKHAGGHDIRNMGFFHPSEPIVSPFASIVTVTLYKSMQNYAFLMQK